MPYISLQVKCRSGGKLADKFWPGPLTMILKKSDIKTVAVTVSPDEEQILKIQDKGFDYVQIHGELSENVYNLCKLPIIRQSIYHRMIQIV